MQMQKVTAMLNTQQIFSLRGSCTSWLIDTGPGKGAGPRTKGELTTQRLKELFESTDEWLDYNQMSAHMNLTGVQCAVVAKELHLRGFLVRREEKRGRCSRAVIYRRASINPANGG